MKHQVEQGNVALCYKSHSQMYVYENEYLRALRTELYKLHEARIKSFHF